MLTSDFERAIANGLAAEMPMRYAPAYERAEWLRAMARWIEQRHNQFAEAVTNDIGKTIRESRAEVARAIDTLTIASEEAFRVGGDTIPMDRTARGVGVLGMTRRFPIGLCGFVAPFNFPLNLAVHKIGPALAVGNPFVLKMPSVAVETTALLADCLSSFSLPKGGAAVANGSREAADILVTDPRIKLLSFTGSPEVGWAMKARAGKKQVVLELGGNAAVIVEDTANLDEVAAKIVAGAFGQAGQSCISVQRILVKDALFDLLCERLVAGAKALSLGDPMLESTDLGPLVSESAAMRVAAWVEQAVGAGGRLLTGGRRDGAFVTPTLLTEVPVGLPIVADEVFGPVAVISRYRDFSDALREVNASRFGLQTGIFTRDYGHIMRAFETLNVGGVIVGNVPGFRLDHTPYGGIKESGLGREGVRSAIAHMTEEKLLVLCQ